MKAQRLVPLFTALVLLALLAVAAGAQAPAAPASDGCQFGGDYDPACDVNHDGHINVYDIQLTAGHWDQTGTWTTDHNHLGETWTGTYSQLRMFGSYGDTINSAPLMLSNSAGDGLYICDTGSHIGCWFNQSDNGIEIGGSIDAGVFVHSAGRDGVFVYMAGLPGAYNESSAKNGFEVAGAESHGLYVGYAGLNGVEIYDTGAHGVYIGRPDRDGVKVDYAGENGVYANTERTSHEWGFITPDKVSAMTASLSSVTIFARVAGQQALNPGDVVAAVGVTDPLPDSNVPLALVQLAGSGSGVIGVVEVRMALTPKPQHEDAHEQEPVLELRSAEGPAMPGDYVALTVLGVAQVKVDAGVDIQAGQRLTAADGGKVRPLGTVKVQLAGDEGTADMAETAPTVGIALAAPGPGQDTIPVFVTLR